MHPIGHPWKPAVWANRAPEEAWKPGRGPTQGTRWILEDALEVPPSAWHPGTFPSLLWQGWPTGRTKTNESNQCDTVKPLGRGSEQFQKRAETL